MSRALALLPFQLVTEQLAAPSWLTLVGAPGARITARLKPVLAAWDRAGLRFDSPHLTPDSAYCDDAERSTNCAPISL